MNVHYESKIDCIFRKEKIMTLISNKGILTNQLGDINTLLILFGNDDKTIAVHNKAMEMKDDNELMDIHVPLRVEDLSLLTTTQQRDWQAAPGKYIVLRVNETTDRDIISEGQVTKFFTKQNKPGKLKIQLAFNGGL